MWAGLGASRTLTHYSPEREVQNQNEVDESRVRHWRVFLFCLLRGCTEELKTNDVFESRVEEFIYLF